MFASPARAAQPTPVDVLPARIDAAVRGGSMLAFSLLIALTCYWWAAASGVQEFTTVAGALTSIGQLSGLVGSALLLAQVFMMARVPVLERAWGQDRLTRIHRLVGFTSFNLIVVHVVTVTWGYAGASLLHVPAELWDLTVDYPGMLLAVAGTGCLAMVVVTSIKRARRRLRYESWHLIHLYGYLGAGLALPHQLWTGQSFAGYPISTVLWWTLWAATAATVIVLRVLRPLRLLRHRLRVTRVVDEVPGVWSVYLTGQRLDRLKVEPGQFYTWRFGFAEGWTRGNPYSLSAAPDGRSLRVTIADAGDGSAATRHLKPGTPAWIEGPFGRLSPRARTRSKVAFIGAGAGMAPLRALAEGMHYEPGEAVLIGRFTEFPLFAGEFDALVRERGLQAIGVGGHRRSRGSWLSDRAGTLDDRQALLHWIPDINERDVFLCGPDPWVRLVVASLKAAQVPDSHIHIESFAW